jgi:hypothetical protein
MLLKKNNAPKSVSHGTFVQELICFGCKITVKLHKCFFFHYYYYLHHEPRIVLRATKNHQVLVLDTQVSILCFFPSNTTKLIFFCKYLGDICLNIFSLE